MLLRNLAKINLRSGRRNGKEVGFLSLRMHKSKHCDVEHWASREEGEIKGNQQILKENNNDNGHQSQP